ncbi:MAG: DsbE family thiol:disulfide interchange protein [Magnetococcales bacterium]|nr:DsbE family thiol:disulfide interchange protein [Magnetococcales bacterium]
MWKTILLLIVMAIIALFAFGLGHDPREIPSPLKNRPAPPFSLESVQEQQPAVTLADYRGRWLLVNFWGSWCVSCVAEHPYLIELAAMSRKRGDFAIVGIDFRDSRSGAQAFLARHGNPGYAQGFDPQQRVAIDWGVYGAPESYVVDPEGIIRLKQAGPLYPGWFEQRLRPLLE